MSKGAIPSEVHVPGGHVKVEPHRMRIPVPLWIRGIATLGNPYSLIGMKQDIVIYDESKSQELYRDGPYDSITLVRPLNQLVHHIEETGLEAFLRSSQLEAGRLGLVRKTSRVTWLQEAEPYLSRLRSWRNR